LPQEFVAWFDSTYGERIWRHTSEEIYNGRWSSKDFFEEHEMCYFQGYAGIMLAIYNKCLRVPVRPLVEYVGLFRDYITFIKGNEFSLKSSIPQMDLEELLLIRKAYRYLPDKFQLRIGDL